MEPLNLSNEPVNEVDTGSLRLGLAGSGDFRWATVDLTGPLETLRRRLDPSPVAAIAMGRSLAAAALLLRFSTKYPGRLRFEVSGDGPLGKVVAEVISDGSLRAMVDQLRFPGVEGDPLNVSKAVGSGLLKVTQESERRPTPWTSQTNLVTGGIGEDVVHFLHQSMQIQSAALLTTKLGPSGIMAAGGLLVEALPGASEERLAVLEKNIGGLKDVGAILVEGGEPELLARVMDGFDIEVLEEHSLRYGCSCSREVLLQRLMAMPRAELEEVADEEGKATLECSFCLSQYTFSIAELDATN